MTVTFNAQTINNSPGGSYIEEVYKEFFNLTPKNQAENWWIIRIYITTSDKNPIKWNPYDYAAYGTMEDVEGGFTDWCCYLKNNKDIAGYKIVTVCLDMLNGYTEFSKKFSKEHWQPKEKIYINGPNKKPFPAKAAKHYGITP